MKITLLGSGTSTGVPQLGCSCEVCRSTDPRDKRLRASVMVQTERTNILIDCGPDFRTQMLDNRMPAPDALLITHEHYDHVAGIDDVRPYCKRGAFPIYAEERVAQKLRVINEYMFRKVKYPGVPNVDLIPIEADKPFMVGDAEVLPLRLYHYKLPVLGFRIGRMAYLTDFSEAPDSTVARLDGVELLIIDALRIEPHMSHLSLAQAIEFARRTTARRVVFTHMSHQMGLHAQVALPEGFELGYDGMTLCGV